MCYQDVDHELLGPRPSPTWYRFVYHVLVVPWTCSTELWHMSYQGFDNIVLFHWPCCTWLCTMWYWAVDRFYIAVYDELPGNWPYCTGPLNLLYRSVLCVIRTYILCYWATGPRTHSTRTWIMSYHALDEILPFRVRKSPSSKVKVTGMSASSFLRRLWICACLTLHLDIPRFPMSRSLPKSSRSNPSYPYP